MDHNASGTARLFLAAVPDTDTALRVYRLAAALKRAHKFDGKIIEPDRLHISLFLRLFARGCLRWTPSLLRTAKIIRLPSRPRLAPELAAAVHRQGFAGHEFSRGSGEVDAGFRDIPGRACAHHRIRARIGRAGSW